MQITTKQQTQSDIHLMNNWNHKHWQAHDAIADRYNAKKTKGARLKCVSTMPKRV